ncbi:hypothetical protein [Thiocapsa sp.]|uniref:hypothetical protein n=1 Tax=Thiocapsa sp. TaxID=2024551 RepID=UPI0035935A96
MNPGLILGFLAIYIFGEAKTGLSALALKHDHGVSYPTVWLIHQSRRRRWSSASPPWMLRWTV